MCSLECDVEGWDGVVTRVAECFGYKALGSDLTATELLRGTSKANPWPPACTCLKRTHMRKLGLVSSGVLEWALSSSVKHLRCEPQRQNALAKQLPE